MPLFLCTGDTDKPVKVLFWAGDGKGCQQDIAKIHLPRVWCWPFDCKKDQQLPSSLCCKGVLAEGRSSRTVLNSIGQHQPPAREGLHDQGKRQLKLESCKRLCQGHQCAPTSLKSCCVWLCKVFPKSITAFSGRPGAAVSGASISQIEGVTTA